MIENILNLSMLKTVNEKSFLRPSALAFDVENLVQQYISDICVKSTFKKFSYKAEHCITSIGIGTALASHSSRMSCKYSIPQNSKYPLSSLPHFLPTPKYFTLKNGVIMQSLKAEGLKKWKGGAEISRGGTTWKLIRKGSENNIRQEGFGSMDQNRSTFSTAYIGRWQSTFTNGSASHGFKKGKERSGEGKKRRVTIMKGCVTEKAATEKTKIKRKKI